MGKRCALASQELNSEPPGNTKNISNPNTITNPNGYGDFSQGLSKNRKLC